MKRALLVVFEDHTLRDAVDMMTAENVGRLIVVSRDDPAKLAGIITRSDVLSANARRLHEMSHISRRIRLRQMWRRYFGGKRHKYP